MADLKRQYYGAVPLRLKSGTDNMKLSLMEITSQIQDYISHQLVLNNLRHCQASADWNPQTSGVSLSNLYNNVHSYFKNKINGFDVPAGVFNKVIDDMTRIGLLTVDRKTKRVERVAYDKLVSEDEMTQLKAQVAAEGVDSRYCSWPEVNANGAVVRIIGAQARGNRPTVQQVLDDSEAF